MEQNKITPALWYHTPDGRSAHVTEYYSRIFADNFKAEAPIPLGETLSGYTELCTFHLFGNSYLIMSTATEHHAFNDSFAIMVQCDDQKEIDTYWDYFTREGKPSMCGWCQDKFGLRWQIIPKNLAELMSRPNSWQVMGKQSKIVIEDFLK